MAILALFVFMAGAARAEEAISVKAAVESQSVYVGQPFLYQIQVNGHDEPSPPDLSAIKDFKVEAQGGQKNNSQSVTIINGQMSQVVQRGYIFQYRLTATKAGDFVIPALTIRAGTQTVQTQPLRISVGKPGETDDIKLRQELSRPACCVGEPVVLTITLYIGKDLRNVDFTLPVLENHDFAVVDPPAPTVNIPGKYVSLSIDGAQVIAERGQGTLDGRTFTTVQFRKILFPRKPGAMPIPVATVACDVLTGRRAGGFDSVFEDDFFGRNRGAYQKVVAPSNALSLRVTPLPTQGQPADFSGWVGEYAIEAQAAPTQVNVGDPITLTIKVSGPDYLQQVELPALTRQKALAADFKIPEEMAPGKVEGTVKTFTQTIRAVRPSITAIPAIEIPYFNPRTGTYQVARTRPIPLVVKGTKVVTARDAEGRDLGPARTELESWQQGIAHNYEDLTVLEDQDFSLKALLRSPVWLAVNGSLLAAYLVLLTAVTLHRRAHSDPRARRARKAYGELRARIKTLRPDDTRSLEHILDAVKEYLGAKLDMVAGSLTFRDVEDCLRARAIDAQTLDELKGIFDRCEAQRYAGGGSTAPAQLDELRHTVLRMANRIEATLK